MKKLGSDVKVGETFEYNDSLYRVDEYENCETCAFYHCEECCIADCTHIYRKDHKNVQFTECDVEFESNVDENDNVNQ